MHFLVHVIVAALAASSVVNAVAEPAPIITAPPDAMLAHQQFPRQAGAVSDGCEAQFASLVRDLPKLTAFPGLVPWLGSEISSAVATATPGYNLCDDYALSARVTPPPELSAAWSTVRSQSASWVSAHGTEAQILASSCRTADISSVKWGFQLEELAVTDKAGCESVYSKYLGFVPTMPKATVPSMTSIGVFTTVTPGMTGTSTSTAGGTAAKVSTSTSGNAAPPRETGFLVAAAAAVLGAAAFV